MKADEDVKMISAEAPVLFAKAWEMFIIELTHRSYYHTIENKRKTLQRSDIAQTIASTDIYDFLQDIIPKEELKEAQANNKKALEENSLRPVAQNLSMPQAVPQDIMAGGLSIENTPQINNDEQEKNLVKEEDIKIDPPVEQPKPLPIFAETDPSNLNQNDLKEQNE